MKHPNSEEWMAHLYGESDSRQSALLNSHLAQCSECRQQIEEWKAAGSHLDSWKIVPAAQVTKYLPEWIKWAAAAAVLIGISFGAGRLTQEPPDMPDIRSSVVAEVGSTLDARIEQARREERKEMMALLQRLEQQRAAEYAALRKDLDTMAVEAEGRFDNAQRQLGKLVAMKETDARY